MAIKPIPLSHFWISAACGMAIEFSSSGHSGMDVKDHQDRDQDH